MTAESATDRPRVAVLVEHEFDDAQVAGVVGPLRQAGVEVIMVGPVAGTAYRGKGGTEITPTSRRDARG